MAAGNTTATVTSFVPGGVNQGNRYCASGTIVHALDDPAMTTGHTLTVTVQDATGSAYTNLVPIAFAVMTPVTPALCLNSIFAITSHNRTTGVTVLTCSGNVAKDSQFVIEYLGA